MTNITHCPYTGIKKMRYLFMAEHMPEQLKELKRQGMPALDAYMDQVQKTTAGRSPSTSTIGTRRTNTSRSRATGIRGSRDSRWRSIRPRRSPSGT